MLDALTAAVHLIVTLDPGLVATAGRSLAISLAATAIAAAIGLPLGALLAVVAFPGRGGLVVLLDSLMGLPPVVVGLVVYLMLSRAGPLGPLGLLFTPTAMVIAQAILVLPIIAALARRTLAELWSEYDEQLRSLGAGPARTIATLLWDARFGLTTVTLAGFGRASAEVGAVMIVGGNIAGVTRTMTTAIALETGKGDLALALGLGLVLILLVALVNAAVHLVDGAARRQAAAQ
jgi:tungstate transport system permease protein